MRELLSPGLVSLLLTNRCNLKCRHCISASGEAFKNELTIEKLFDLIDQCGKLNVFFVDFNGGEPFLHPYLGELVKRAYEYGIRCVVTSNGTLITNKWLDEYGQYVFMFRISLDSDVPSIHDDFRGIEGCWELTTRAIRQASLRNNVTVLTCVQRHNIHSIESIYDLACEMGASAFNLTFLLPEGRGADLKSWVLRPEEIRDLCLRMKDLRENARSEGKKTVILEELPERILIDPKNYDERRERMCGAAMFEMAVTPNGVALPCSSYVGLPWSSELSVLKQSLEDIWQKSELFQVVRNRADIEDPCKKCDHFHLCFGGCRAAAYSSAHSHTAADPTCWLNT